MTMRSLEIRTDRFFNNLIEQNQKLAADFVLKQSKIVSTAHSPTSTVKSPASRVQSPASRAQRPESSVQSPAFRVQRPVSNVQLLRPESRNSGMLYKTTNDNFLDENSVQFNICSKDDSPKAIMADLTKLF